MRRRFFQIKNHQLSWVVVKQYSVFYKGRYGYVGHAVSCFVSSFIGIKPTKS